MTHFANLKASLGKSLSNLGFNVDDPAPDTSPSRASFDSLRIVDPGTRPHRLPALFHSRERDLGDPVRLFPERTCKKSDVANMALIKRQWLNVLDGLKAYGLRGQIAGINTYLNRSADTAALASLGQKLPWTGPLTLFHNAGSEHIALAKYLSLRKIGVSAERLRLVWIEDHHDHSRRVVLAATFGNHNYILDNRRPDIIEDEALDHFRPYCSTNASHFSLHWDSRDIKGWETSLKRLGSHALH